MLGQNWHPSWILISWMLIKQFQLILSYVPQSKTFVHIGEFRYAIIIGLNFEIHMCDDSAICFHGNHLKNVPGEGMHPHILLLLHSWQKRLLHPIEDNKTNVDRTFVFPLGWNWHDMDPWLFPNGIRHYLEQTFNARSSGIVELRNHSIGGRSPKSIFTLWQFWINICIFF